MMKENKITKLKRKENWKPIVKYAKGRGKKKQKNKYMYDERYRGSQMDGNKWKRAVGGTEDWMKIVELFETHRVI